MPPFFFFQAELVLNFPIYVSLHTVIESILFTFESLTKYLKKSSEMLGNTFNDCSAEVFLGEYLIIKASQIFHYHLMQFPE